jgi:hypothetical protein
MPQSPVRGALDVRARLLVLPNEWKGLPRPELSAGAETGNECHDGKYEVSSTHSEGEVMAIVTVGIDLAKNRREK